MAENKQVREVHIGEVYLVEFTGVGSEQRGLRPAVIFSNNVGNRYSPNVIALPLTSTLKRLSMPTHVLIKASRGGLAHDSVVLCENPERVSKCRLGAYITTLTEEQMQKVAIASILAMGAISFIDDGMLSEVRNRAINLNRCSC